MLTVDQVIAVLEKALANPNYLGYSNSEKTFNYFCASVHDVLHRDTSRCTTIAEIQAVEDAAFDLQNFICNTYIYPSIYDALFLMTHLITTNKIKASTMYYDEEYKVAAHAHWQHLIDSLKTQQVQ